MLVKYPERGKVKTRLTDLLDGEIVLDLYRCFVSDMIRTAKACPCEFAICFDPPEARDSVEAWLGRDCTLIPQLGEDLGERLKHCFSEAFTDGFERVVVIGSDSPDLPAQMIDEAFASLDNRDVVIGPSVDGGYYLIGFKSSTFVPGVFDGVEWGSDSLFAETMATLRYKQFKVHVLSEWADIDTFEDLMAFFYRNVWRASAASETMTYMLNNYGRII
jgi:uncharacterized protein